MAEDRRRFNGKKPTWNVAEGERLYFSGLAIYEIAKVLNQPYMRVYDYARVHWYGKAVNI